MMKKRRNSSYRVKAGDIVIAVLVIAASVATMVLIASARTGEKGGIAVVEVNGKEVMRFELGDNQPKKTYTFKGLHGPSKIVIEGGRVKMLSSTCRDKICIGTGWIDTPVQSIVCLPNRVVVHISGKSNKVDTVTE